MTRHWTLLIALTISAALPAFGSQIRVPADQPSIQQGINAAAVGDIVLVAPGTYNETISFGKDISVISEAGPAATIIDAHRAGVVVTISGNTARSTRLQGFTIRNGNGGITIYGGRPTIANNIIITNATCSGSGILVSSCSPLIISNIIAGNFMTGCTSGLGAGIYVAGTSAAEIIHNIITNNSNFGYGGGIECFAAGTPVIRDN